MVTSITAAHHWESTIALVLDGGDDEGRHGRPDAQHPNYEEKDGHPATRH